MNDLDTDAIPFPFGGMFGQIERHPLLQRTGQHERAEDRHVAGGGRRCGAGGPLEQRRERRCQAMPNLLHRLHIQAETLRQPGLGQPRRDADAQCAGGEFDEGITALHIQPIEQRRDRHRCLPARQTGKLGYHFVERGCWWLFARRIRPKQRNRFRHVANEIMAEGKQRCVHPFDHQRLQHAGLHRLQIDRAGERRQRPATIGIGRRREIIRDQPQLGGAAARVEQRVEQAGKGFHRQSAH